MNNAPMPPVRLNARARLAVLTAILLIGAGLRLLGLDNVTPPGLEHDEVAHWLINQDILAGNHAIYFTEAYGHEALYHYLQTGLGVLLGDHALGLRLPSAYLGLLLIAISYALGRRLFGWPVALAAAAFLAVLFWPVFYSRLALRAIALPVFAGLAALFWWRGWAADYRDPEPREVGGVPPHSALWLGLAGIMAGLSIHTYMAARALPVFFLLFVLYLLLFHRLTLRARWPGVAVFFLAFALVSLPLLLYLRANPGAEFRISEVDAPLRALSDGDLGPVLANVGKVALMFGVQGDPLWRQGIAGQPVFGPLLGLLFYAGVALVLWRWRDERYAFLLLWLGAAILPSVATIDAPSTIRIVMLLPVLTFFPMLVIHRGAQLSTTRGWLSTRPWITAAALVILFMWSAQLFRTVNGVWRVWPANDEVRFVWQKGLTDAARFLDQSPGSGPVAVGGWTPATMDPPTMALTLRRTDLPLRFFDPAQSLILPAAEAGEAVRIVRPAILPLAPALEAIVGGWSVSTDGEFALYEYRDLVDVAPEISLPADFGNEISLLGYTVPGPCEAGRDLPCILLTFWRVNAAPSGERRFFLHGMDSIGALVAQDDRSGVPSSSWQPGDMVIQQFTIPATSGGWRLGVYDPATEQRLPVPPVGDYVPLGP